MRKRSQVGYGWPLMVICASTLTIIACTPGNDRPRVDPNDTSLYSTLIFDGDRFVAANTSVEKSDKTWPLFLLDDKEEVCLDNLKGKTRCLTMGRLRTLLFPTEVK